MGSGVTRIWGFGFHLQVLDFSSLRSMAVLSSRAHERTSGEHERRSREKKKNRLPGFEGFLTAAPFTSFFSSVAPAPISSRFLCPRPPLLLSAPNQNRHATQAMTSVAECADSTPTKSIERVCVSTSSKEQICLLCAKVVSNNDFRRKLTSSRGPEKQKLVSISSQYWERRFHNQGILDIRTHF